MAGAGAAADLPRILNMTVPQVGHLPLMALRPFFMVSSTPSEISFLALHLTQYPSAINFLPFELHARNSSNSLPTTFGSVNYQRKPLIFKGFSTSGVVVGGGLVFAKNKKAKPEGFALKFASANYFAGVLAVFSSSLTSVAPLPRRLRR